MQFPAPKRLPLGPLMDFGYENEVLFPFGFKVSKNIDRADKIRAVGPYALHAKVNWLVCREVCIPGKADLELDRKVWIGLYRLLDDRGPSLAERFFDKLDKQLPAIPTSFPSDGTAIFQPTATGFRLAVSTGQRETQASFFPEDENILDNPAPQTVTPTPKGFFLDLKKDANLAANPAQAERRYRTFRRQKLRDRRAARHRYSGVSGSCRVAREPWQRSVHAAAHRRSRFSRRHCSSTSCPASSLCSS